MDVLSGRQPFSSLSVSDLLAARDAYHWHLVNKRNVVGTAIGLYLIRHKDGPSEPRTFDNSEVRDYSWPCVLVLVDTWVAPEKFGMAKDAEASLDDLVPKTLYLPDGRMVPVCVVKVTRTEPDDATLPPRTWPAGRLGGGFPLLTEVQGEQHLASAGALVTDGHTTYVLTSRHVTGPAGEVVSNCLRGTVAPIGRSAGPHLTRLPFDKVYPEFPAQQRTSIMLDAGLIKVDDVTAWSSRTFGLPPTGELADLNELNLGLPLIGAPVRSFGAASGNLSGRIAALFYRYRSVGGYDDVTDFLIVPDPGGASTRPGDSGTVWHLVQSDPADSSPARSGSAQDGAAQAGSAQAGSAQAGSAQDGRPTLRPIALEWGGQGIRGAAGRRFNFTLAANLTSVLRLLSVDLVTEHNVGAQPFWGRTGHYTIASYACDSVTAANLKTLLTANRDRLSFPLDDLGHTAIEKATVAAKKAGEFLPLADVPDLIWKNLPWKVRGGRDVRSDNPPSFQSGPEHPCHYADIDQPDADGAILRRLCVEDPANIRVEVWQDFYTKLGHTEPAKRGLLPFRVWQFFDAMVAAVHDGDLDRYVAAAGLLAHYVGDACQPLHGSYLSNGLPDGTGKGVHTAYEDNMFDRHDVEIGAGLPDALAGTAQPDPPSSGKDAAAAVIQLMDRTAAAIDPLALVNAYAAVSTGPTDTSPTVTTALWDQFGQPTINVVADGIRTLAAIWTGAWTAAGGEEAFGPETLTGRDPQALQNLYESPDFVPSLDLDHIGPHLSPEPGRAPAAAAI